MIPCLFHIMELHMTDFSFSIPTDVLRAALVCVSTEETRYYLRGFHVEPDADDVVLVSTDGPHASVIKMKPPMVINSEDMNHVVESLEAALDHHKRSDHRIRTWMRSEHQVVPPAASSRQSALGRSSLLDSVLGRGGDGAQPHGVRHRPPAPLQG